MPPSDALRRAQAAIFPLELDDLDALAEWFRSLHAARLQLRDLQPAEASPPQPEQAPAGPDAPSGGQQDQAPPPQLEEAPPPQLEGASAGSDAERSASEEAEVHVHVPVGPPAKRQRLGGAAGGPLRVRGNARDRPAPDPPLFKRHRLREEQLRSLGWMLKREAQPSGFCGGLLGDRMGYGKTATTIALISQDVRGAARRAAQPGEDLKQYIPGRATLIIAPPHLVEQWEGEFVKFLGEDAVQICRPTKTPPAKNFKEVDLGEMRAPGESERLGIMFNSDFVVVEITSGGARRCPGLQVGDQVTKVEISWPPGQFFLTSFGRLRSWSFSLQSVFVQEADETAPIKRYSNRSPFGLDLVPPEGSTMVVRVKREKKGPSQRVSTVRGSGAIRILAVGTGQEHGRLQLNDIIHDFDVVLVSSKILGTERYRRSFSLLQCEYGSFMKRIQQQLRVRVASWNDSPLEMKVALSNTSPVFEIVRWRRIVFDEFHESASWLGMAREVAKGLSADSTWGLSGTPPLGSTEQVVEVAELLGYTELEPAAPVMKEAQTNMKSRSNKAQEWRDDAAKQAALREEAQRFLDACVRQNASALVEGIGVVEHLELVEHTPQERLIYRQACHDQGIFDLGAGYEGVDVAARAALLQRCAHFSIDEEAADAEAAVRRLGDVKRTRIQEVQLQLRIEAARSAAFGAWGDASAALRAAPTRHAEASRAASSLLSMSEATLAAECAALGALAVTVKREDQHGRPLQQPEVQLQQPLRATECHPDAGQRHIVVHAVSARSDAGAADLMSAQAGCSCDAGALARRRQTAGSALSRALAGGVAAAARLLDAAYISLDFYQAQLKGLSDGDGADQLECSICQDAVGSIAELAILPCSHVFHAACIREAVQQRPQCPICKAQVQLRSIGSVVMELQPAVAPAPPLDESCSRELRAHGSKLNAMAVKLQKIRREDATAKAIVFVQWATLEDRVADALLAHGIACLRVPHTGAAARQAAATLRRFQEEDAEGCFVLLLSLERAASGANLSRASHVLFVHPMNARSVGEAVAYERQALGRVRRVGQARGQVHVHRFVTADTVEQHVHGLHRAAVPDAAAAAGA